MPNSWSDRYCRVCLARWKMTRSIPTQSRISTTLPRCSHRRQCRYREGERYAPDQPDRDHDDPPQQRTSLLSRPACQLLDHCHHPPRRGAGHRPLSHPALDRRTGRGREPPFSRGQERGTTERGSPDAASADDLPPLGDLIADEPYWRHQASLAREGVAHLRVDDRDRSRGLLALVTQLPGAAGLCAAGGAEMICQGGLVGVTSAGGFS